MIHVKTLFIPANAAAKAAELTSGDEDWTYEVKDHSNGWAEVQVFDEDGEYVESISG